MATVEKALVMLGDSVRSVYVGHFIAVGAMFGAVAALGITLIYFHNSYLAAILLLVISSLVI